MTVGELIAELSELPQETVVVTSDSMDWNEVVGPSEFFDGWSGKKGYWAEDGRFVSVSSPGCVVYL